MLMTSAANSESVEPLLNLCTLLLFRGTCAYPFLSDEGSCFFDGPNTRGNVFDACEVKSMQ